MGKSAHSKILFFWNTLLSIVAKPARYFSASAPIEKSNRQSVFSNFVKLSSNYFFMLDKGAVGLLRFLSWFPFF